MTRARLVRGGALFVALLALGAVFAVSAWSFISPNADRDYRLAAAADFAPGTVTSYVRSGDGLARFTRQSPSPAWGWSTTVGPPSGDLVHVVRLDTGELRVFAGTSPHLGQTVLWFPDGTIEVSVDVGWFGDDFSWWSIDGTRIYGPTPRDLPEYRFEIDDAGVLVIDLSEPVAGEWRVSRRAN